jgi:ankyrin repeat protein
MLPFLIDNGADVNAHDSQGSTPLQEAVGHGLLDDVRILLAHGAHLNEVRLSTGATPVNEAVYHGNARLVEYLLQFRPDLDIPDNRGERPFDNAIRIEREDCAVLLLKAEKNGTPQQLEKTTDAIIRRDNVVLLKVLLRTGVSANTSLPSGITILESAALVGSIRVVQSLLENGADANLLGHNGTTPLQLASLGGFSAITSILLDHGAQVNHVNDDSGVTTL